MDRPSLTTRTLPPGIAAPAAAPAEATPLLVPPHTTVPGRARGRQRCADGPAMASQSDTPNLAGQNPACVKPGCGMSAVGSGCTSRWTRCRGNRWTSGSPA